MPFANYLTILRFFISPLFLLLYWQYQAFGLRFEVLPYILLALLTLSELSDAFDGYIARKYNQVTDLGKILDPMADSVSHISMFLTFTLPPVNLPMLLIFVFLYRDAAISTLRIICALRGVALAARPSGKIKTVVQGIAVGLITASIIPFALGSLQESTLQRLSFWIVAVVALYTVCTAMEYILANRLIIKQVLRRYPKKKPDLSD